MSGLTSILGSRFEVNPPKRKKPVNGPPVTLAREQAIADSLGPERCQEIAELARIRAAFVMAEWEAEWRVKRGRR